MKISALWSRDEKTAHTVGASVYTPSIGMATCKKIWLSERGNKIWASCLYEGEEGGREIISFIFTEDMRVSYAD